MHFSTATLHFVLLSFLGASKTALASGVNAAPNQDAFGATNYGFQCFDRVYPKSAIYAATKHFCDTGKNQPDKRFIPLKEAGYRNRYLKGVNGDIIYKIENPVIPILADGTLYSYESRLVQNSAGEMVKQDPGPDRILVDLDCNILGAFSDLDYETYTEVPRVKNCRVLKSIQDYVSPSGRSSPEQSPPRSPQLSREPSPARSRGRSRGRSSEPIP
ncbi:hypothetical protein EPUL_005031 [Erysiphe pulchra]|uniref:Uncharacterized protein n=1 Tax=Erysiphe pulchra TaxID=225359 RepID=A0A2S4PP82_9PEZI|nr:hypothetical protein EPUL_005031 [Erysiphe pulchra]